MTAKDAFYVLLILVALFIGYILSYYVYVKQNILVNIQGQHMNFKSNRIREGDTYTVIINQDTVRGKIVNGEWE